MIYLLYAPFFPIEVHHEEQTNKQTLLSAGEMIEEQESGVSVDGY